MRTEAFSGKVEEYQGQKLATPISYDGTANLYTNVDEAKASEDWPSESGILKMVNQKLLTAAKASKYQEVTKPLKEAYENSDDFKRKNLIDSLMAAGKTKHEATALAESIMGKAA